MDATQDHFTAKNMPGKKQQVYDITYRNILRTCSESDKGILMICVWKMEERIQLKGIDRLL